MATAEDYDFSVGDAGASMAFNSEAGQVRVGGYIIMKGDKPCKVSAVSTSKTGKHGHAKCNFTAINIFDGKKHEDIIPSTHTCQVPNVVRKEYELVDITEDDGFVNLMSAEGDCREDIKLPIWPENYARELILKFKACDAKGTVLSVVVMSAMGHDQIMSDKEVTEATK
jgi:translation initiation factor 5A